MKNCRECRWPQRLDKRGVHGTKDTGERCPPLNLQLPMELRTQGKLKTLTIYVNKKPPFSLDSSGISCQSLGFICNENGHLQVHITIQVLNE